MRRLLSRIFHNWQYKITAIVLAMLTWYLVQGEEILEINRRIIVTLNVPDGYMIKGKSERIKDASLRGPRVVLGNYSEKPLEATIHIPRSKTGQLRYRVDKEFIKNWDARIKLTVHDPYLTVFVDEQMTRRIPVKEFLQGVPADDYIIEKTIIKPSTVSVTGLKSEISRLKEIQTEPIDVSGLQATKSFEAPLAPAGDIARENLSEEKVTVSLQVGEKKINNRISSVPVQVVGSEFLAQVKPRYVSIVIQGTPGVLSFVKRSDLEAFVEARDLEPGKKYNREIQVKIPQDTVLIETFPESANVEIFHQRRIN